MPARQPAEWERHDACWLAYPSHRELWREQLEPARGAVEALCRAIASGERVELLCRTETDARTARERLAELGDSVRLHRMPYGDIWLRDTAPIFTVDDGGALGAARFWFNGWGGKYRLEGDPEVSRRIADAAGVPSVEHPLVLEGGAIDVDGAGTLLTTRQCLLNSNRNPKLREDDYAELLEQALGARTIIWLHEGLLNDHTDGHVDTVARFVGPGRVVCMEPADDDPNRDALRAIISTLSTARDTRGERLEVTTVPSPGTVTDDDGGLMPASYVNFYIANDAVALPIYGCPADDSAVAAIEALFPGRRVVPIEARAILTGGGALHCITQQQPSTS